MSHYCAVCLDDGAASPPLLAVTVLSLDVPEHTYVCSDPACLGRHVRDCCEVHGSGVVLELEEAR